MQLSVRDLLGIVGAVIGLFTPVVFFLINRNKKLEDDSISKDVSLLRSETKSRVATCQGEAQAKLASGILVLRTDLQARLDVLGNDLEHFAKDIAELNQDLKISNERTAQIAQEQYRILNKLQEYQSSISGFFVIREDFKVAMKQTYNRLANLEVASHIKVEPS